MRNNVSFKKIHIKKLLPIFKKEMILNLHSNEVLILGGNGAGKTSFLRLLQSLTTLNFSELLNKSTSHSSSHDIDIDFEVQIKDQYMRVSFQEKQTTSSKDNFSNKLIQQALNVTSDEITAQRSRAISIDSKGTSHHINILINDEKCLLSINNSTLIEDELKNVRSAGTPSLTQVLMFLWSSQNKKDPTYTALFVDQFIDILLFFQDESPDLKTLIFNEDKSFYDFLLKETKIVLRQFLKDDDYFLLPRGSWFIDVPFSKTIAPHDSSWVYEKIINCIEQNRSSFSIHPIDLPLLGEIANDLGVKAIKLNILLHSKQSGDNDSVDTTWFMNSITIVDNNDNEFDSENLSYGQKRYLSLLIYLSKKPNSSQVYLIDEPTNGLHHRFIKKFYYDRPKLAQLFMTTQSPWLLNYVEIDEELDLSTKFILCKKEQNCFVWRNFNKSEIKTILSSRKSDIQRMDEILRTRNIW